MAKKTEPAKSKTHTAKVSRNEIVAIRRALMNYIGLLKDSALEGQQDPENELWTEQYVKQEIARCRALLDGQFRVTW